MTPPPESYEKRQRDRRKQQRRKEKLERRLQRKNEKRHAQAGGANPIYHTLRRGAAQHRVDTDLWLCVLDLAAVGGWTPPETQPPEQPASSAYARPAGLKITTEEARGLAQSIEALLPMISEQELPLSNHPFGEEHTEDLLSRRAAGEKLAVEDASAAHELLSGPPKKKIESLATFLKAGPVSIEAS